MITKAVADQINRDIDSEWQRIVDRVDKTVTVALIKAFVQEHTDIEATKAKAAELHLELVRKAADESYVFKLYNSQNVRINLSDDADERIELMAGYIFEAAQKLGWTPDTGDPIPQTLTTWADETENEE